MTRDAAVHALTQMMIRDRHPWRVGTVILWTVGGSYRSAKRILVDEDYIERCDPRSSKPGDVDYGLSVDQNDVLSSVVVKR